MKFSHMSRTVHPDAHLLAAACGRMHVVHEGFLYAGRFGDVTSQRPSAVLYLALTPESFDIETRSTHVVATAVLVGPNTHKRLRAHDRTIASIDISPTHSAFPALARAAATPLAWPRAHFASVQQALVAFRHGDMDSAEADRLYDRLVALAASLVPAVGPIDPRVREVMRLLRERPGRPMSELAEAVSLSKDWLVHLFQRELGIPLRKFEQALKVHAAAAYLQRGVSLTEVAAIAGFSDSAHFSRLWKQHYGFPPQRSFNVGELFIDPMPWPPCTAAPVEGPDA